jgi:DNA-directed RNA polymerase specialized sigma24 family protein
MDEQDFLAERFEENRTHLRAVAYRMLGSLGEADDAVQEAWLRLSCSDTSGIENLGGWLKTVMARVCLNMLRSRCSWSRRFLPPSGSLSFCTIRSGCPSGRSRFLRKVIPTRPG